MKILLTGLNGTLVNFDNVFDIHSAKLTDGWRVRARCASFYQDCYETVTLFKGQKKNVMNGWRSSSVILFMLEMEYVLSDRLKKLGAPAPHCLDLNGVENLIF